MRLTFAAIGLASFVVVAAQAQGGLEPSAEERAAARAAAPVLGWNDWALNFRAEPAASAPAKAAARDEVAAPDLDVVDAHWMALTMWGEARGSGEEGMRAVGHVIDNRRRSGRHGGFATDTVSEAYQFSCWNPGDPNLRAIRNVDALASDSHDALMWQAARRIAEEILSGRSADPTDGALFYHAASVAPLWSRGLPPVRRIGGHLFFLTAR
jgi:spore germination cell wall hydrolase CwlJ-like protein